MLLFFLARISRITRIFFFLFELQDAKGGSKELSIFLITRVFKGVRLCLLLLFFWHGFHGLRCFCLWDPGSRIQKTHNPEDGHVMGVGSSVSLYDLCQLPVHTYLKERPLNFREKRKSGPFGKKCDKYCQGISVFCASPVPPFFAHITFFSTISPFKCPSMPFQTIRTYLTPSVLSGY